LRPQQFGDGVQGGYLRFQDWVRSGVAFGTTVSPVAGWGDRIDPVQFGQLATFRRLNSPIVNLVIGSPQVGQVA